MSDLVWTKISGVGSYPDAGRMVRVLYSDGQECNASRAGGAIFYPQGSNMYRYRASRSLASSR